MAKIKLTKATIDRLKAADQDVVYWDDALAGFGLKVTPRGRKVFFVLYRTRNGAARLRKYTIGPYGIVTPATARATAQRVLAARQEGRDPAEEKRLARLKNSQDVIDAVVDSYLLRFAMTNRSAGETGRVLKREVLNAWSGRSIHGIAKKDVLTLLDRIVDRGSPGTANRTFKALRALFNWCIERSLLERSPCANMSKPMAEKPRERLLTDDDLVAVVQGARIMGFPYGSMVEFLILTAQRRGEVAGLLWDEIDFGNGIWRLPASRTKNGRSHTVHLSSEAIALLKAIPHRTGYVFGVGGARPTISFSQNKRKLDELSSVTEWVIHDLRRTAVTGMASLGVPPHVADKVLNHQVGTISGVAAVYQRHEFLIERKGALFAWSQHVQVILGKSKAIKAIAA
jgi:integrase